MSEARPDEAEVEAVKRRLRGEAVRVDENNPDVYFVPLGLALDALDAARRSPQGESPDERKMKAAIERSLQRDRAARSPQGEDHQT